MSRTMHDMCPVHAIMPADAAARRPVSTRQGPIQGRVIPMTRPVPANDAPAASAAPHRHHDLQPVASCQRRGAML